MSWTRVSTVDFDSRGDAKVSIELRTVDGVKDALVGRRQVDADAGAARRTVYLVEVAGSVTGVTDRVGTPTAAETHARSQSLPSLGVLQRHFHDELGMPEELFQDHLAIGTRFGYNEELRIPALPSALKPSVSWSLEYFEMRSVMPSSGSSVAVTTGDTSTLTCEATGREIQRHKWNNGGFLLVISRKCTFWSRPTAGGGWDGELAAFLSFRRC